MAEHTTILSPPRGGLSDRVAGGGAASRENIINAGARARVLVRGYIPVRRQPSGATAGLGVVRFVQQHPEDLCEAHLLLEQVAAGTTRAELQRVGFVCAAEPLADGVRAGRVLPRGAARIMGVSRTPPLGARAAPT